MPNNILKPQRVIKKRKNRRSGGTGKRKSSRTLSNKTISKIMAPMTYVNTKGLGANTAQVYDNIYVNACIDNSRGFYGLAGVTYGRFASADPIHSNRRAMDANYTITDRNSASALTTMSSPPAWQDLLERGYLKSLDWTAGRQYWMESFALPVGRPFHPESNHTAITDHHAYPCFTSLVNLMFKSAQRTMETNTYGTTNPVVNSQWPMSTLIGTTQVNALNDIQGTSNVLPWIEKTLYQCNFKYHGGKQIHTFQNTLNITSYGSFYELIPKIPLTDFNITNPLLDPQQPLKIWALVRRDLQLLTHLTSKGKPWTQFGPEIPTSNYSTYAGTYADHAVNQDEPADPDFMWNKRCPTLFHYFHVVKTSTAVIRPGETFTYTMALQPFHLTLTTFRQTLLQYYNTDEGSLSNRTINSQQPQYFPGFSKFLVARFKSARVHGGHNPFIFGQIVGQHDVTQGPDLHPVDASTSTIVQQPNPGAELNVNINTTSGMPTGGARITPSSYTTASIGPGCLTHTMQEIHSCQTLPIIPIALTTKKNLTDGASSYWDIPNSEPVGMIQGDGDNQEVDLNINIVETN